MSASYLSVYRHAVREATERLDADLRALRAAATHGVLAPRYGTTLWYTGTRAECATWIGNDTGYVIVRVR